MARRLIVEIVGDSASFERSLAKSQAATSGFAGRMERTGAKLSRVGHTMTRDLTLPIVGIGVVAAKSAMDFQSSMELLATQAHAPQAAIAGLSKEVLALAGPVATAPDELAKGLYHIVSQGVPAAKQMEALRVSAEGAKIGQADLEDVTNALGAVLASKIGGIHTYAQAMGMLNATVGAGDMRMQDLADAYGTGLASIAATAHVSLPQINAGLATLGDNNIRGAKAGTMLISTMRVLGHQSTAGTAALQELGVNADVLHQKLATGGLTGAVDYLTERLKVSGKSTADVNSLLSEAFGGKQATGIKLFVDQVDRLHTKLGEVEKGGSSFASDWAKYTQTTAYHFDQMGAQMRASGINIGDMLTPVVSGLINKVSELTTWWGNLGGGEKEAIVITGGVVAALGPLVSIVGNVTKAIGATSTAVEWLIGKFAAMGAAEDAVALSSTAAIDATDSAAASAQAASVSIESETSSLAVLSAELDAAAASWATFAYGTESALAALSVEMASVTTEAEAAGAASAGLMGVMGPLGIVAGAAGIAYMLFAGSASQAASAQQQLATAIASVKNALQGIKGDKLSIAVAKTGEKQAILNLAQAEQNLKQIVASGTATALQRREAELQVRAAHDAVKRAVLDLSTAQQKAQQDESALADSIDKTSTAFKNELPQIAQVKAGLVGLPKSVQTKVLMEVTPYVPNLGPGGYNGPTNHKPPKHAQGVTNFKGGWSIVGENGPELIRLPQGSDVLPMTYSSGARLGDHASTATSGRLTFEQTTIFNVDGSLIQRETLRQELRGSARGD